MSHRIVVRLGAAIAVLITAGAGALAPVGAAHAAVVDDQINSFSAGAADETPFAAACPVGTTPLGVRVVSVAGYSNDVRMLCQRGGTVQTSPEGDFVVEGGVSEDIVCPAGQRVAGLYARVGTIIDSIGVRCADGADDQRSDGPISLGQGGGPDGPVDCPPLSVLRGIAGTKSAAFSGSALQVNTLRRVCSDLTVLTKLTRGSLQLRPKAKLVLAATGEPLAGRRISFGRCSAITNAQGIATCALNLGFGPVTASYAGDARTEPSSARS